MHFVQIRHVIERADTSHSRGPFFPVRATEQKRNINPGRWHVKEFIPFFNLVRLTHSPLHYDSRLDAVLRIAAQ